MSERKIFGGFANAQLDPCYHQACDTIDNIDQTILGQMARAAAFTVEAFAKDANLRTHMGRPKNW